MNHPPEDLRVESAARSVAFVTPRVGEGEPPSHWARTVAAADTAVIYMGAGDAARVRSALLDAGVADGMPAALVESASLEGSRSVRGTLAQLEALAATRGEGPVVIILGRIVGAATEARLAEAIDSAIAA